MSAEGAAQASNVSVSFRFPFPSIFLLWSSCPRFQTPATVKLCEFPSKAGGLPVKLMGGFRIMPAVAVATDKELILCCRPSVPITGKRIARILFCIPEGTMVLLHGFVKKTRKTPDTDLATALKRKGEVEQ
jgi:hypothetical protein